MSAVYLFLDVLELLLQLLYVSVDVGVVFVPLQGRDVSAGCLGAMTQQHVENKTAIQATGASRTDGGTMAASKCDHIKARRLVKDNLYCTSNINGVRQHYCLSRFPKGRVFAARAWRKRRKHKLTRFSATVRLSSDSSSLSALAPGTSFSQPFGLHTKLTTNKHKLEREDVKQQMMKW